MYLSVFRSGKNILKNILKILKIEKEIPRYTRPAHVSAKMKAKVAERWSRSIAIEMKLKRAPGVNFVVK